jgi:hypothetical protein
MKIDVTEDRTIRLKEVFNSVIFETEEGEDLVVCMRDGGYEIGVKEKTAAGRAGYYNWYRIMDGQITPQIPSEDVDIGPCNGCSTNIGNCKG